ncbi:hypothetical protein HNQ88_002288 [Aureibacter tunicatorum]|uniref:Uncharacterized protein n=1 Tax=Aureibacter tunicatorum TaxID=866807 RepID=A0AAE3XNZ0_9BACT|nr:hypothetical protein [Aureibacter tunicatorum]BDD04824.1 hypothetical protein AUTU_23070 [Aureibacter tunicatorum]
MSINKINDIISGKEFKLEAGLTKRQIINLLGEPDDILYSKSLQILKYDSLQISLFDNIILRYTYITLNMEIKPNDLFPDQIYTVEHDVDFYIIHYNKHVDLIFFNDTDNLFQIQRNFP